MALVIGALGSGCSSRLYDLQPPPGFATVEDDWRSTRLKAADNVGMSMSVFDNVKGGSLRFWGADLQNKLKSRDYALVETKSTVSGDGVVGTRFDFDYTPPGSEASKFLVVVLFVTDDYRFVLQLAGRKELRVQYAASLPATVADLRLSGCGRQSSLCEGGDPKRRAAKR
ncbi:MAG: hypothetical protein JKY37_19540 [Nannocystaceae bacterium]|nr:hypothetical protein [Nannocystaceae bacterium]